MYIKIDIFTTLTTNFSNWLAINKQTGLYAWKSIRHDYHFYARKEHFFVEQCNHSSRDWRTMRGLCTDAQSECKGIM